MSLSIDWERKGEILIAVLSGRIDGSNADQFLSTLEAEIDPDHHHLILDFERVSFISSAGLRVGLLIAREYRKSEKDFALCTLSDPIRGIFSVSGFDRVISIYASKIAAINALEKAHGGAEEISEQEKAKKILTMKTPVDFNIVGDNIRDIADLTVEKHEFRKDEALPSEIREGAVAQIKDVLWQRVEQLKARRGQMLEGMFSAAEASLGQAVDEKTPASVSQTTQRLEEGSEEEARDDRIRMLKSEVDLDIVEDSVQDIAEFTVEKYEFEHDTNLSSEAHKAAVAYIKEELGQRIERLKGQRNAILGEMFRTAEETLDDVLAN